MTSTPSRPRRLLCAAALACGLGAASALAADAPVVTLPAEPPHRRTVELQEVWRVGGLDDEDVLIGFVRDAARDAAGNTYLVDSQLSQVLVMGPDGELAATLGREGDGPGEFRRPNGIFVTPDIVGVVQGFPGKIVKLDHAGYPAGTIEVGGAAEEGGFRFLRDARWDGERLVCMTSVGTFDQEKGESESRTSLLVCDLEGNTLAEFVPHTRTRSFERVVYDEKADFSETSTWTAAPGGTVYTHAARDAYRINARDLDGNLLRVLERPFTPRERTQEDKDRLVENMVIMINGRRREIENRALDTDPAIVGLDAAADGRLFVTNCRDGRRLGLPDGVAARYDVLAPDGTFVEQLTLACPEFDREQDRLLFLDGRHFLLMRRYESAAAAMRAGFGGADDGAEPADLGDVEPLEIVLMRI